MTDDYRKPATPKSPSQERGTKVRRAEAPSERAPIVTGADPRKKPLYAAQSAAVAAELEAAKRTMAITSRALGAIVLAITLASLYFLRAELIEDGVVSLSARGRTLLGIGISLGPWLLAFGNGGAASPRDAPEWFRWGALTAFLIGFGAAITGNLEQWIAALLSLTI